MNDDLWLACVFLSFGAVGSGICYWLRLSPIGIVAGFVIGGIIGLILNYLGQQRG